MNYYHHLSLCLLVIYSSLQLHAAEQTAFWKGTDSDGAEVLWMTRHNGAVGTAHALGSMPTVLHAQFVYDSAMKIWEASFVKDTRLPMSLWWRANNELVATPTESGVFRFPKSLQTSLEVEVGSNRTHYQAVASLQTEILRYPLKIYKCEQTISKLQFNDTVYRPLETELASLTQSSIEKAHAYWNKQYERDGEILITPRREIAIEQRLLHLQPDRCTLLLITQTYSSGAHGNSDLLALNYFRSKNGSWQRYVPLTRHSAPEKLKVHIRDALNQVDADGDYFDREETDVLDPATRLFQVLKIGATPWAIFEPYTVAAGAFGSFSVPINP